MPSSTKTVVALSGFLGRATDWDLIGDLLPKGWNLHAVDLLKESLIVDFDEWATRFNGEIMRQTSPQSPRVLLGYSMGGRLALHALAKAPTLFSGAMIVSANPGLINEDDRRLRRQADEVWAAKFMHDPWPQLMNEWNSQPVLRPPASFGPELISLERKESDFQRSTLSKALRTWSIGKQRNLRAELAALQVPIEFVTGQDDLKFTSLTRDLVKDPAAGPRDHEVIEHAGHRVPWDAPVQFRAILAKFLSRW